MSPAAKHYTLHMSMLASSFSLQAYKHTDVIIQFQSAPTWFSTLKVCYAKKKEFRTSKKSSPSYKSYDPVLLNYGNKSGHFQTVSPGRYSQRCTRLVTFKVSKIGM